jgi:hypothetical protein
VLLCVPALCLQDYYAILGVSKGSDENELKKGGLVGASMMVPGGMQRLPKGREGAMLHARMSQGAQPKR